VVWRTEIETVKLQQVKQALLIMIPMAMASAMDTAVSIKVVAYAVNSQQHRAAQKFLALDGWERIKT
jgi:tRNA(Leu) C34 or U34 (ribose-2'-O)-methylase TrmL